MESADPIGLPVPAPPVENGEPTIGVSVPFWWRLKPATLLWPAELLST